MHNIELVSPVEVCELPGPPAVTQVIQQALVLSVQADVVGDREGLLGKAGDAIHHIVSVEVQPEVIPVPCLTGHDLHPLEQKTPGKLWRRKEHLTWHTYRAVSEGFPARSSHCLMPTTLLLKSRDRSWRSGPPGTLLWLGHRFSVRFSLVTAHPTVRHQPSATADTWGTWAQQLRWQRDTRPTGTCDLLEQQLESGGMPRGIPSNTG